MTLIKSSSKWAYYNEIDPFAAAWLRELIKDGLIAPGEVDERSIEDVLPIDVTPFRQAHWFSGIGVWSLALRQAGWSDCTPVWTGSCPCQPFSAAGKGGGFADERHLWPAFHFLIEQCQPPVILGEQVAGRNGDAWLDLVSNDMEATGYAFGAIETVACGFGAPHKRSRNYWVAHAARCGQSGWRRTGWRDGQKIVHIGRESGMAYANGGNPGAERKQCGGEQRQQPENCGVVNMADTNSGQCERIADGEGCECDGTAPGWQQGDGIAERGGTVECVAGAAMWEREQFAWQGAGPGETQGGRTFGQFARYGHNSYRPGPTNGYWRDADWLRCTDEKWRPVEPGTFPLADAGAFRNRVGLLRGAGNAITIGQAQGFIQAVMESI